MAAAVARAFEEGGVLLAEAGTGTGKTLAYLVPAILSRQRVLISTGTKNLQEQIFFKDIPALRDALDVPFTATYMKGRANYLCLHRLDQLNDGAGPSRSHDVFLPIIREWAARTDTGDRAELEDLPEDLPFWNEVSATAETCLGTECPRYDDCFVTRMRQRAAASDVVIVNHHLLCADAAVRQSAFGEVIPACSHRDRRRSAPARGRRDAVLRLVGQHLPARGSRARRRAPGGVEDASPIARPATTSHRAARSPPRSRARVLHASSRSRTAPATGRGRGAGPRHRQPRSPARATRARRSPGRSTSSRRRSRCSERRRAETPTTTGRVKPRPDSRAAPARSATNCPVPAPGGRPGVRLLRRVPRQGRLPARGADRRRRRSSASCCSTACGRPC